MRTHRDEWRSEATTWARLADAMQNAMDWCPLDHWTDDPGDGGVVEDSMYRPVWQALQPAIDEAHRMAGWKYALSLEPVPFND